MRSRSLCLTIGALFVMAFAGTVRAEIFTAYLTPVQEVPPVASTGSGFARVIVNADAGTLTWTVVFTGLTSNQISSHIHAPAPIGMNAGIAIDLGAIGGTGGTITGSGTITPTQLAQLRQGLGYVNVHSANNTGGELRGQLAKTRPVDYDGDGRTDLSVLKFPNIAPPGVSPISWWNLNSTSGAEVVSPWGNANTDFPAPGDYDGDGRTDIAIYRAGATAGAQSEYWVLRSSDTTAMQFPLGLFGDQTVQRDYDGDGKTDFAVFRRGAVATASTTWWIRRSSVPGNDLVVPFGLTGNGTSNFDTPVAGDYDGDGKFDIAVYRFGLSPANNFIILRSSDGAVQFVQWGNFQSDYILPGDYDGDGMFDFAAGRTGATAGSPMVWWIRHATGTVRVQPFGISSDLPVQGDYDGDGRTDLALYRRGATAGANSTFWVFKSFDSTAQSQVWGLQPDFPVATFDAR